ncbi:MAG: hypothetical protein IT198_15105 [Acidimicrobiia bacterium]|nr:hypothetical protein [Acidimicrobiia bacterium]
MVATDLTTGAGPAVRLEAGDDASGFACMIGDLLADNLRDYAGRRRVASRARGDVVLTATDKTAEITLSFGPDEIVVREGRVADSAVLAGPWVEMAKLCSGRLNPLKALASGTIDVDMGRHPALVAATGFVLSVPPSYYGDTSRRRNVTIGIAVAVGVGAAVTGVVVWRRRRG